MKVNKGINAKKTVKELRKATEALRRVFYDLPAFSCEVNRFLKRVSEATNSARELLKGK